MARKWLCIEKIETPKRKGDNTYESAYPERLEERITPGVSEGGHPAQTADPEHTANLVARMVRKTHHGQPQNAAGRRLRSLCFAMIQILSRRLGSLGFRAARQFLSNRKKGLQHQGCNVL